MKKIIAGACWALATCALVTALPAAAQDYPRRTIRMIAPFAPGGGSDVVARVVATKLSVLLGQSVVVENRPGASGIIGADVVAKAPPDGYTVLMTNSALTSNPWLYKKLPYNTEKDLIPVSYLASSPTVAAAHPSAPFNTLAEMVDYARKNPKHVSVGTPGAGQMSHLAAEMVSQVSGADLQMIHYKGTANSMSDLLGGNIMMSFGTVPGFINHIQAGKLKPIAVASPKRLAVLPNVPAVAETYPGFEMTVWFGTFVSAGTPRDIIEKLHKATAQVLADPAVRAKFADEGLEPGGLSSQEFDSLFRADLSRWKKFVQDRHIQIDN